MTNYSNTPMDIAEIPQFPSLKFNSMAKNYPLLSCLQTLFFWAVLITGLGIFVVFNQINSLPYWLFIVLGAFITLNLFLSFYSARLMGYLLREKDILYKQGVFWKRRTGVSFKRIQHIDITHGPLERKFELATIKFFTAGGSLADLKISGLPKKDAEKIRSIILEKISLENSRSSENTGLEKTDIEKQDFINE